MWVRVATILIQDNSPNLLLITHSSDHMAHSYLPPCSYCNTKSCSLNMIHIALGVVLPRDTENGTLTKANMTLLFLYTLSQHSCGESVS